MANRPISYPIYWIIVELISEIKGNPKGSLKRQLILTELNPNFSWRWDNQWNCPINCRLIWHYNFYVFLPILSSIIFLILQWISLVWLPCLWLIHLKNSLDTSLIKSLAFSTDTSSFIVSFKLQKMLIKISEQSWFWLEILKVKLLLKKRVMYINNDPSQKSMKTMIKLNELCLQHLDQNATEEEIWLQWKQRRFFHRRSIEKFFGVLYIEWASMCYLLYRRFGAVRRF